VGGAGVARSAVRGLHAVSGAGAAIPAARAWTVRGSCGVCTALGRTERLQALEKSQREHTGPCWAQQQGMSNLSRERTGSCWAQQWGMSNLRRERTESCWAQQ